MDTGWQLINGIWYKREDLYTGPFGVNGSKYRTWESVISGRPEDHVVVAGSVHAPTVPIVAAAAMCAGKMCTVIVGGTTPEKALRHRYIEIASDTSAEIRSIAVGYGPALKAAARDYALNHPGVWNVRPPAVDENPLPFLEPVGQQLVDLAPIETLVIPFGSGNTTSGILYGLSRYVSFVPKRIVLVGIGPDQQAFVRRLISAAGADTIFNDVEVEIIQLHDWFARYGDRMPESLDGIDFHPTYEGKVIRYLNIAQPEWWTRRDGSTGFWIVGGPF